MRSFRFSRVIRHSRHTRRGLLTFEWILIFSLLAVGIVGGLAAVRDALNVSYGSVAGAALGLNATYEVKEFKYDYVDTATTPDTDKEAALSFKASAMSFTDSAGSVTITQGGTPGAIGYP